MGKGLLRLARHCHRPAQGCAATWLPVGPSRRWEPLCPLLLVHNYGAAPPPAEELTLLGCIAPHGWLTCARHNDVIASRMLLQQQQKHTERRPVSGCLAGLRKPRWVSARPPAQSFVPAAAPLNKHSHLQKVCHIVNLAMNHQPARLQTGSRDVGPRQLLLWCGCGCGPLLCLVLQQSRCC